MAQSTLLVNVQPGASNVALLRVSESVASLLEASVIGVAAWQPLPVDWTAGDYRAQNFSLAERSGTNAVMNAAEAEFREVFPGPESEWRTSLSFYRPSIYIVQQVRQADLVLTGMPPAGSSDDVLAVAGDLVMQAGRPVLIVPSDPADAFKRVMLAWKETPQCRRAILDALPFLKCAVSISIVEIASAGDLSNARRHVEDVASWLRKHGVAADPCAVVALNDDAEQLETVARSFGADLIVAGAWSHSQFREWMFGGVTRRLLRRPPCCSLLAH